VSVFLRTLSETLLSTFNRKVLLIFIAIVLDAVATVYLMYQGYGEANPVMDWIANMSSPVMMAITKIVWSLLLLLVIVNREEFRKYINHLIIAYFVIYTGGWWAQFTWEVLRWTL
jgi:hypothetical protein